MRKRGVVDKKKGYERNSNPVYVYRRNTGLSQTEFGKWFGLSQGRISKLENRSNVFSDNFETVGIVKDEDCPSDDNESLYAMEMMSEYSKTCRMMFPECTDIDSIIQRSLDKFNGDKDRMSDMLRMKINGYTLEEIGSSHGISTERVRQVILKYGRTLMCVMYR